MNDITTLGTFAGCTAVVLGVVQLIKPMFEGINIRLVALLVSILVLEFVAVVTGGGVEAYGLALINSFLVASAAMGAYEVTFAKSDAKKLE